MVRGGGPTDGPFHKGILLVDCALGKKFIFTID